MILKRFVLFATILNISACITNKTKPENQNLESSPKLLKPIVKKIWIPPEIKNGGSEWTEGHFLYRIERSTTWSR